MRAAKCRIMVIDDLADREHECEILLDQNFYNLENRYVNLVPKHCKTLLGPGYLLLDQQYEKYNNIQRIRSTPISSILVFFGSVDLAKQTQKVLDAIPYFKTYDLTWNIVIGSSNPDKEIINELCEQKKNGVFHCQIKKMSALIFNADLAIGAGGVSSWERCKLGFTINNCDRCE